MNLKLTPKPIVFNRRASYPVDELFIGRYSPREYNGETIARADLFTAFEAARWAPSSLNYQPWRFIFALRENDEFPIFVSLLDEKNQIWAKRAAALIFIISSRNINYKGKIYPAPYNEFDAGAAWSNFAHQAFLLGYKTRAIGGFDKIAAREKLNIPDDYDILIGIAIGKEDGGNITNIPSERLPLEDIICEGKLKATDC